MRYGFINNFSQTLAAELAAGATTMTLDDGGERFEYIEKTTYALTLDDGEGNTEIVYVTGATGNALTVLRGQEGTTNALWPAGTIVEQRLTANAVIGVLRAGQSYASGDQAIAYGDYAVALGDFAIALGTNWTTCGAGSIAIGKWCQIGSANYDDATETATSSATATNSVALGVSNTIHGGVIRGITIGTDNNMQADCVRSISIGHNHSVSTGGKYNAAIGRNIQVFSSVESSVAIGDELVLGGSGAVGHVLLGQASFINTDEGAILIGKGSRTDPGADNSVGLGADVRVEAAEAVVLGRNCTNVGIHGGLAVNALPYLRGAVEDAAGVIATNATRRASQQAVIATDPLDLTDGAAAVTLDLPAGTMLFIDSIDVVVTGSDTPGGSPEIVVGPDDATPAAYLAATAVTKTTVGGREVHSPIVADGVTSLRVATNTAGTGTTYQAKVVFRGYVMEL